jgi:hypothetical protein
VLNKMQRKESAIGAFSAPQRKGVHPRARLVHFPGVKKFIAALAVIASMGCANSLRASTINNYGNFIGPNVTYTGVTEVDTQLPPPDPANLFGPPTLSGDSLLFNPLNFVVSVAGGSSELQDGRLSMGISTTASPAGQITAFSLTEGGAYGLNGSASTFAREAFVINNLFITAINGVSVNPIVVTPTITFTHTGGATTVTTADSITFVGDGSLESGSWNATAAFNIAGALAANGFAGSRATGLQLSLDNQLSAQSQTGTLAFIDKKNFLVGPSVGVPEPATFGLALFGFALLGRARKSRA